MHGINWSSFLQSVTSLPSYSPLSVLFHASATKWHTVVLLQVTKNLVGKWFQFKCNLVHFSRGKRPAEESMWGLCWALQPLHSLLYVPSCAEGPAVMTSLRSAEHLQPGRGLRQSVACLCRWHLLPWGPRIISALFSQLLNVNLFVDCIICGGVMSERTMRRALAYTHTVVVKWVDRLGWICEGR